MGASHVTNLYAKPTPSGTDQRLTVDSTAGGVQFSTFSTVCQYVGWDLQGADMYVTFDGTAPTTSNGHKYYDKDRGTWSKATAQAAKMIRADATNGTVHASEFSD